MSLEDDLFAQRLRRTAEIEALGFRAYGQRFDASHTIPQILADFSDGLNAGNSIASELALDGGEIFAKKLKKFLGVNGGV